MTEVRAKPVDAFPKGTLRTRVVEATSNLAKRVLRLGYSARESVQGTRCPVPTHDCGREAPEDSRRMTPAAYKDWHYRQIKRYLKIDRSELKIVSSIDERPSTVPYRRSTQLSSMNGAK
jgi:hypothetical protein